MTTATSVEVTMRRGSSGSALAEFEQIYRSNVGAMTAYFARRCADPQTVADLTSETIVAAAGAFGSFDPGRGTARAWLVGIAGLGELPVDEIDELADKIDAERAGRELIERCSQLPALERGAVELVDLDGLTPKEAAAALGVPRGVLRMRLSRARARLRKEHHSHE